jgi:hypothetical protein
MAWTRWRRREAHLAKGIAMAFTIWALATMGHSAMRLAAPGFAFGLASARFQVGEMLSADGRRRE